MHKSLRLFIALTFFTSIIIGQAPAADWPAWRGPNSDGISAETNYLAKWPAAGPEVLWRAKLGVGCSSISVADGRMYSMGSIEGKDVVWSYDAESGKKIWDKRTHRR